MDKNTTIVEAFNSVTVGQVENTILNVVSMLLLVAVVLFITAMFSRPRF